MDSCDRPWGFKCPLHNFFSGMNSMATKIQRETHIIGTIYTYLILVGTMTGV